MSDKNSAEILEAIKNLENSLNKRLSKIEKDVSVLKGDVSSLKGDVSSLKDDMRRVLKCVDHENADFDPVTGFSQDHRPRKTKARI